MIVNTKEGTRVQINTDVDFYLVNCCNCGVPFMMPTELNTALRKTQDSFYCPNGHSMSYTKSTAQILKEKYEKELAEKNRELHNLIDTRAQLSKELINEKRAHKKVALQMKRVENGVCPCCNRSFVNLQRHMKTKHPEVK